MNFFGDSKLTENFEAVLELEGMEWVGRLVDSDWALALFNSLWVLLRHFKDARVVRWMIQVVSCRFLGMDEVRGSSDSVFGHADKLMTNSLSHQNPFTAPFLCIGKAGICMNRDMMDSDWTERTSTFDIDLANSAN